MGALRKPVTERQAPEDFFRRARLHDCLEALEGDHSPDATILRWRTLNRLGRVHDVIAIDHATLLEGWPSAKQAAGHAVRAIAYFRADIRAFSEGEMRRALSLLDGVDLATRSFVRFQAALLRSLAGDWKPAEREFVALTKGPMAAGAFEQLGWIAAHREDYIAQVRHYRDAFGYARSQRDVWVQAHVLFGLAVLARERYDPASLHVVEELEAAVEWTPDTAHLQCYVKRYLGTGYALAGRDVDAYRAYDRAHAVAPGPTFETLCLIDRAHLAAGLGERASAAYALERARETADACDWREAGEDRNALLLLAELTASSDPIAAKAYVDRYIEIRPFTPLLGSAGGDRRRVATEQYAAGIVYAALGDRTEASKALKLAYRIWREVGYEWRAVIAMMRLADLSWRPDELRSAAREIVRLRFPNAWFRAHLDRWEEDAPDLGGLSAQHRAVLAGVLRGDGNEAIAATIGRSTVTVKKKVTKLLTHFGVTSRFALISRFQKR